MDVSQSKIRFVNPMGCIARIGVSDATPAREGGGLGLFKESDMRSAYGLI
jgi:hypothetical protein